MLGRVRIGVERALAARARRLGVRVLVMAEAVGPPDVVAHGLVAVLGVGRRDLERHAVAPREESAVRRVGQRDLGGLVADRDHTARRRELAGFVRHAEAGRVRTQLLIRVRRGDAGRLELAVAVEIPLIGELVAVGVDRGRRIELDRERRVGRRVLGDSEAGLRRLVVGCPVDAVQARIRVLAEESIAVVEHPHRPVGADLDVHRVVVRVLTIGDQLGVRQEVLDVRYLEGVPVDREGGDIVLRELAHERLAVPVFGKLRRRGVLGVVVVDRSAHRRLAVRGSEVHELIPRLVAGVVAVVHRGLARRGELGQTGVPSRLVDEVLGVVELARNHVLEVPVVVGSIRAVNVRPARVVRVVEADDVPLDVPHRAAVLVRLAGVGSIVAPRERVRLRVDLEAERVAHAHHEDLGAGQLGALLEEVALGDRVRAVFFDVDAQDLAAQVVGVARTAAGVEARVHAGCVVGGRVPVGTGGAGGGVVARREVEVALIVEVDVGAHVAALAALGVDVENGLLGRHVEAVAGPLHAREAVDALPHLPVALVLALGELLGGVALGGVGLAVAVGIARRVDEVDPAVVFELRIERDALQPVLRVHIDVDLVDDLGRSERGVVQADVAVASGRQDPPVRHDRHVDRLADVACDEVALVVAGLERRIRGGGRRFVVMAFVRRRRYGDGA